MILVPPEVIMVARSNVWEEGREPTIKKNAD